jgi:hypothetical protein
MYSCIKHKNNCILQGEWLIPGNDTDFAKK